MEKERKKKRSNEVKLGKVVLLVLVLTAIVFLIILVSNRADSKYSVTFEMGNGTGNTVVEVDGKEEVLKPADPVREGYIFEGWYVGNSKFDFSTKITEDIILTAKWTKIEVEENIVNYTVTFDSNSGSEVEAQTIQEGIAAVKPANPTRSGYTFAGWYNGNVKYDFTSKVTEDITLTAKWTKVEDEEAEDKTETVTKYTVKFDYGYNSKVTTKSVEEGKTVAKPSNPTRSGYTFAGWYNGSAKYDFTSKVTGNITLTAKWTKVEDKESEDETETVTKYTVKFDYGYNSKVTTKSVEEGKTVAKPSNPTRSGYTFAGWYNGSVKYDFSSKVTGNITLTAKWEKEDVITVSIVETNSVLGQQLVYVLKNGQKVAGTVVKVKADGTRQTLNVPATGITVIKGTYEKIINPTVK